MELYKPDRPNPTQPKETKKTPKKEKGDVKRIPRNEIDALMKFACDNCSFKDFTPVCNNNCVPERK